MLFPYATRDARWIVVDRDDPAYDKGPYEHRIDLLGRDKRWRLIYRSHGVLVFRRQAVEK
jgi:hypothetical protein